MQGTENPGMDWMIGGELLTDIAFHPAARWSLVKGMATPEVKQMEMHIQMQSSRTKLCVSSHHQTGIELFRPLPPGCGLVFGQTDESSQSLANEKTYPNAELKNSGTELF